MPTEPTIDALQISEYLLPETIRPYAREVNAYLRELPRLVAGGDEGRYALIHGGELLSVWNTSDDAEQAGYDRFGLDGEFLTQPIHRRDLERFRALVNSRESASE